MLVMEQSAKARLQIDLGCSSSKSNSHWTLKRTSLLSISF